MQKLALQNLVVVWRQIRLLLNRLLQPFQIALLDLMPREVKGTHVVVNIERQCVPSFQQNAWLYAHMSIFKVAYTYWSKGVCSRLFLWEKGIYPPLFLAIHIPLAKV
jgi:hypothetical protein